MRRNLLKIHLIVLCFVYALGIGWQNASAQTQIQLTDNIDSANFVSTSTVSYESAQNDQNVILTRILEYANFMIRYGRDKYGNEHSPLFAQALTRDPIPTLIFDWNKDGYIDVSAGEYPHYPYPNGVFHRFTNIPLGYEYSDHTANWVVKQLDWDGNEYDFDFSVGAHKQIVCGMDVSKNNGLLNVLYRLSSLTADEKYSAAADSALHFWFQSTQNQTSGLYPWGEHLGWDFVFDAPAHSELSPNANFWRYYASEWDGDLDFWDALVNLPVQSGQQYTPLEKLALGLWQSHFWDKEKVLFDRHANYYTGEFTYGEHGAFPRLYEHFMHVWSLAYTHSTNEVFRDTLAAILYRNVEGQRRAVAQNIRENGPNFRHPPFSYINPNYNTSQHRKMAYGFALAAHRIRPLNAELADSLQAFSDDMLDEYIRQRGGSSEAIQGGLDHLNIFKVTGRREFHRMAKRGADSRADGLRWRRNARQNYFDLNWLMTAYSEWGDERYRTAARWYVDRALENYFDDQSPLPRFVNFDTIRNWDGSAFEVWYSAEHGSDDIVAGMLDYVFPKERQPDPAVITDIVVLESPQQASVSRFSDSQVLIWTSDNQAESYRLQVSLWSHFLSNVIDIGGLPHFFYSISDLRPNTRYYWRVKMESAHGSGAWSQPRYFTTATATSVDYVEEPLQLDLHQNFPNPFNPATTISFSIPGFQSVRIDLYTVGGVHVRTLYDKPTAAGHHNVTLDASDLASGVYLYTLRTNDRLVTRTMLFLK